MHRTATFGRGLRLRLSKPFRSASLLPKNSLPRRCISTTPSPLPRNRWLNAAVVATAVGAGWMLSSLSRGNDTSAELGKYATTSVMIKAAKEIQLALGEDAVTFDEEVIENHGHSDWSTSNTPVRPVAIVYPKSTEEVSQVAKICNKLCVPIVPYGAGSSVEGNFSSPLSGICVDFTYMNKILSFNEMDMDIVVQPGVNWVDMNTQIRDSGLFLPMDPSPTAQIGGMISTNCSGTNAFRYGTMKDWVINLTVVLADGSIMKTRRRPRKSSAGYNLTSLFVGAEGTLGMVTEATIKLAPIPKDTSVAIVPFLTLHDAAAAASDLIRSGIQLGALELMDDTQMGVINKHGSAAVRKRKWDEAPTLFLKFSGTTENIKLDIKRVHDIVSKRNSGKFVFARNKQEEADLWAARKEALWTMVSNRPEGTELWSTDVAVPISNLADLIAISKEESSKLGLFASVVGHVGDGNFHQAVFYNPTKPDQVQAVSDCVHKMMDRAIEMEGTVSGEHGIGLGKKKSLEQELGPETIAFMQTLKRAVDPKWILNPGKVFDMPKAGLGK